MDCVGAKEVINRTIVFIAKIKGSYDLGTTSRSPQPDDECEAYGYEPVAGNYVCDWGTITFLPYKRFRSTMIVLNISS